MAVEGSSAVTAVDRWRAETPGVRPGHVHFNNAGAGLMPEPVLTAVTEHLQLEAAIGGYEAADARRDDLQSGLYASVARLVNASPGEIAIVDNATVAWDLAFYSLPLAAGDRILTCRSEYAANYVALLQRARKTGAVIEVIPNDESGATDAAALERMMCPRVKLVALTHIPTNGALVNPAAAVGRVCRQRGVPFLLDACQSVGQMPIDVEDIGCDMLSATSRKYLRGPRGVGFLYMRRGHMLTPGMEPPMIDHFGAPWTAPDQYTLRDDARRYETWETAPALLLGFKAAVDYALGVGLPVIQDRAMGITSRLREGLAGTAHVRVMDLGSRQCAMVAFGVDTGACGWTASTVKGALAAAGFSVSVSEPGSTLLDAEDRHLPDLVRASPHYYNTEAEADAFIAALRDILARPPAAA